MSGLPARLLILLARGWQLGPSAILPPTCRFQPSCSQYAIEALGRHGAIKGGWLAAKRLMRCHPLGGSRPRSGALRHCKGPIATTISESDSTSWTTSVT